jgi:hypothetical protein
MALAMIGNFQLDGAAVLARDFERSIDFVGVDGHFAGHQGDLVKTVGDARLSISSDPHSHRSNYKIQR